MSTRRVLTAVLLWLALRRSGCPGAGARALLTSVLANGSSTAVGLAYYALRGP